MAESFSILHSIIINPILGFKLVLNSEKKLAAFEH